MIYSDSKSRLFVDINPYSIKPIFVTFDSNKERYKFSFPKKDTLRTFQTTPIVDLNQYRALSYVPVRGKCLQVQMSSSFVGEDLDKEQDLERVIWDSLILLSSIDPLKNTFQVKTYNHEFNEGVYSRTLNFLDFLEFCDELREEVLLTQQSRLNTKQSSR